MVRGIYYGWWVVAGVFVLLTLSSGFGFYNLSVYISVLAEARGFSVSAVSVAVSLFFVVGGVAGMAVAQLIERYDVRVVMIAGAALGGAALALVGFVQTLWQLYLVFAVFGVGHSAISIVMATTLVTRWFPGPNRSVALSVASTGLSAGGIVLTPLSAEWLNTWGLEQTMPWLAALFFLPVVPIAWWVVRGHPPAAAAASESVGGGNPWRFQDAVRTRFFVLVTLAYVMCMGAQVGAIAHLYNRAEVLTDFRIAAVAVQVLTLASILGRFLGGWLATRVPIRWFTVGNLLGQATGLAIIGTAAAADQVIAGAAVFGATVGNLLMLHPLWLAEAFGGAAYARIFSLSHALSVLGVAAGPTLLGLVFDSVGYRAAYLVAVGGAVVALLLVLAAGAKPRAAAGSAVASGPES